MLHPYEGSPLAGSTPALTTYYYDDRRRVSTIISPDSGGANLAMTYDDCDRVLTELSSDTANAINNTFTYYGAGQLLGGRLWKKTARPATGSSPYPVATATCYYYDDAGRTLCTWGPGTNPVLYVFDALGQMTSLWTNNSTQADTSVQLSDVPFSPGASNGFLYTANWQYDAANGALLEKDNEALSSTTGNPLNLVSTSYHYNSDGTLKQRVGGRMITTSYTYDSMKRLVRQSYSDVTTPQVDYTYHRDGSLATVSDVAGFHVLAQDSATGQLGSESIGGSGALSGVVLQRGYDALGRPASLSGAMAGLPLFPVITTGYGTTGKVGTISNGTLSATLSPLTTSSGSVVKTIGRTTIPTSSVGTANTSDSFNSLVGHWASPGDQFNPSGVKPAGGVHPSGFWSKVTSNWSYQFDSRGQVTQAARWANVGAPINVNNGHAAPNVLVGWGAAYSYDAMGNRVSAVPGQNDFTNAGTVSYNTDPSSGISTVSNTSKFFVLLYTGNGLLATVNGVSGSLAGGPSSSVRGQRIGTTTAGYFGALLSETGSGPWWQPVTIQNNSVTIQTGNLYCPPAVETLGYDADGNLVSDGRWAYTWDAENRLVKMTTNTTAISAGVPNLVLTFAYDAQGRRISKKVDQNTGGTWGTLNDVRFIYDGWNLLAEVETSSTAADIPPGMSVPFVRRGYLWGPDVSGSGQGAGGVGGLLAMWHSAHGSYGASTWWTTWDLNGNVVGLKEVLTSGTPRVATYEYGPFGEPMRTTEPEEDLNPIRFSSKYQDLESGLYYYGFRCYEPRRGVWLSKDPINELGLQLTRKGRQKNVKAEQNLYRFCRNNAVNRIDKLGLIDDFGYDSDPDNSEPVPHLNANGYPEPDVTWYFPICKGSVQNTYTRIIQRVVGGRGGGLSGMFSTKAPFFDTEESNIAQNPYYNPSAIGWGGGPMSNKFRDSPDDWAIVRKYWVPSFETCAACVDKSSGRVTCLGPCKRWQMGFMGDLATLTDQQPSEDFKTQLENQYPSIY